MVRISLENEADGQFLGKWNGYTVSGNLFGDVSGNVSGNLWGSVSGNVSGNTIENVSGNECGSVLENGVKLFRSTFED